VSVTFREIFLSWKISVGAVWKLLYVVQRDIPHVRVSERLDGYRFGQWNEPSKCQKQQIVFKKWTKRSFTI